MLTEVESVSKLLDEVNKFMPAEIICNDSFYISGVDLTDLSERLGITISALEPRYFEKESCREALCRHFHVSSLDGMGVEEYSIGMIAAGGADWGPWAQTIFGILLIALAIVLVIEGVQTLKNPKKAAA